MPKRTSAADPVEVNVVIVTMDCHLASAMARASATLARQVPGLAMRVHAASDWSEDPAAIERCRADIGRAHIVVATMLFMEEHFQPLVEALRARRDDCDAMVCAMSAAEIVRLTRMGRFRMDGTTGGPLAFLRRLRGKKDGKFGTSGAAQMKMLRRIPQILRFVPGTAQDVRAYFLSLQYWLAGSEANIVNMVRFLVDRYADGPRRALRGTLPAAAPVDYLEMGVYHPRLPGRMAASAGALPAGGAQGTIGLLVMRSYLLAGNTGHYDGVIAAMEARGLRVIPAFATGLDARPAVEAHFRKNGRTRIDALVSLTGFSLVGGPAYNDAKAAEEMLADLDVPYIAAHPLEFQTLEQWGASGRGLSAGRGHHHGGDSRARRFDQPYRVRRPFGRCRHALHRMHSRLRVSQVRSRPRHARMQRARRNARQPRRQPDRAAPRGPGRAHGSRSSSSTSRPMPATPVPRPTSMCSPRYSGRSTRLRNDGYHVEIPADAEKLRERIIAGNAGRFGASANVVARIPVDDHVRRERHLAEIETQWGPAPGMQQTDGASLFVLGERFGNVLVGIQPAFGYEGDPMRLLFEKGFAPTHAFSAFYRYLREDFNAHAVLHFGTHGALEFMPGKQTGASAACWPDRLIGTLPNIYLYASNNPSEGAIAKRRAVATLVSYLTPPVGHAGLYKGLLDLKAGLERWRALGPDTREENVALGELLQAQAAELELADAVPAWGMDAAEHIAKLGAKVLELEYTLIPHGLHVVGEVPSLEQRADLLVSMTDAAHGVRLPLPAVEALVRGAAPEAALAMAGLPVDDTALAMFGQLAAAAALLATDHELPAVLRALDGRFVRPVQGGDLLRTPAILPTGRNIHGFDPFRIPSAFALQDGARQAERLLARHVMDGNAFPECIALVLWGTDNLKTEGGPIAQALALMGVRPRFDSYGRLAGATLMPLAELGRPRVDVMMTLSGIFRDLLPLQVKLLAEAAYAAAAADEPEGENFIRKHALAYQKLHGCDLATAALRVFGNADGAYGSNVNHLVENSRWDDEDELAETYTRRKNFAYGVSGRPVAQPALLKSVLADIDIAYQNLDSVELGVTTVDHYFDTLGGITRAVRRARDGQEASVYISDQTRSDGVVRTLAEQVSLETRTRMLNPKWYEGMLSHGYEGVRQIEEHIRNTMGWSATTGQVAPWIYEQITQTFVLDDAMRERLSTLNPTASVKLANRLLEAHERHYWTPDATMLDALRRAGEELEDRLEGVVEGRLAA